MEMPREYFVRLNLYGLLLILAGWSVFSPNQAAAQLQGQNVVAKPPGSPQFSSAWVDTSVFPAGTGNDICAQIYNALASTAANSNGQVIDARGFFPAGGLGTSNCPAGSTPWTQTGKTSLTVPATILLPVGAITINTGWVLPNNTRVIGAGMNYYSGSSGDGTSLIWGSSSGGTMIQFGGASGSSAPCPTKGCSGISLEKVFLDGKGVTGVVGVQNAFAQEFSYVDQVNFFQILGNGLQVASTAANSGPYTNLRCQPDNQNGTTPGACVLLNGPTRGVHGITCTLSTGNQPPACVEVNGSNNSIEDIHIESFVDGVLVGATSTSSSPTESVVVLNVTGADPSGILTNVVHVCGSNSTSASGCGGTTNVVKNVSLFGILAGHTPNGFSITNVLQDDETGTTVPYVTSGINKNTIGMYDLGDDVTTTSAGADGYSRFTTFTDTHAGSSPLVPTWIVDTGTPKVVTNACDTGSIYSNTSGGVLTTVYVCVQNSWVPIA